MASNFKVLLITANVGSIFEDPNHTLKLWLAEFFETVRQSNAQVIALHCQEVGGKNFEESMQHVNQFVQALLSSADLEQFSRVRIFLDEDFTAQEKFTALGSVYFLHNSLSSVEIWDFEASKFTVVPRDSKEVSCGNIEQVPIKEKVKFAKHFFPESQWSRKGFIRTRWHINGSKFDLINVHLFHDASNVTALEKSPSMYSSYRQQAMEYILQRIEHDQYDKYPFFLFGDLNYRLDTHTLIQKLTDKTVPHTTTGKKNEISRIQYTEGDNGKVVLTVDKKTFEHCTHNDLFSDKNISWLRDYDKEPTVFHSHFDEYPITFPPSYPFSENTEEHMTYMTTRCPSWCDRVFLSKTAKTLLAEENGLPQYEMLGLKTCMGDHKPIMLSFTMKANAAVPGNDNSLDLADGNVPLHDGVVAPASACAGGGDVARPSGVVRRASSRVIKPGKVVKINGDLVDLASPDKDGYDIHYHASFEEEDVLPPSFPHRNSLKRRSDADLLEHKNAFANVANEIKSMLHFKNRKFPLRSHSDSESDSDESTNENAAASSLPTNENAAASSLPTNENAATPSASQPAASGQSS